MSLLDKLLELASTPDWITPLYDMYRETATTDFDTIKVYVNGMSPNEAAKQQGKGWSVGYVDYETGWVTLHRRKR
jgi:hypothetical protein